MTKLTPAQVDALRDAFGYWPDAGSEHGPIELEYAILGEEWLRVLVGATVDLDPESDQVEEIIDVLLDAEVVGVVDAYYPIWPEEDEDDRRWAVVAERLSAAPACARRRSRPGGSCCSRQR
ncbi:hypothetical protein GHK86_02600 [Acidimicrobiaceae bacterium USS-CC1]|uniref:Uncharacterized protein n=1 Tax=Acidiferrimicrobium australe TaxID=2664430 RepID=A0ABW9QP86_9ACTN|nr:hypothetical protein [Acidiferrimicrobium australe]